jgi:hypothetical protein
MFSSDGVLSVFIAVDVQAFFETDLSTWHVSSGESSSTTLLFFPVFFPPSSYAASDVLITPCDPHGNRVLDIHGRARLSCSSRAGCSAGPVNSLNVLVNRNHELLPLASNLSVLSYLFLDSSNGVVALTQANLVDLSSSISEVEFTQTSGLDASSTVWSDARIYRSSIRTDSQSNSTASCAFVFDVTLRASGVRPRFICSASTPPPPDSLFYSPPSSLSTTAGSRFFGAPAVIFMDSFGVSIAGHWFISTVELCCGSLCEGTFHIKNSSLNLDSIYAYRVCGCAFVRLSVLGKTFSLLKLGVVVAAPAVHVVPLQPSFSDSSVYLVFGVQDALGNFGKISSIFSFSIVDGTGMNQVYNLTASFPVVAVSMGAIAQRFRILYPTGNTTVSFDLSLVAPQLFVLLEPASCSVGVRCSILPIIQVFPLSLFDGHIQITAFYAAEQSVVSLSYSMTYFPSNGSFIFQDFTLFSAGDIVVVFCIDRCSRHCYLYQNCPFSVSVPLRVRGGVPRSIYIPVRPSYLAPLAIGQSVLGSLQLSFEDAMGNEVSLADGGFIATAQSLLPSSHSNQSAFFVCGNSTSAFNSSSSPLVSLNLGGRNIAVIASAVVDGNALQGMAMLPEVTFAAVSMLSLTACEEGTSSSCLELSWSLIRFSLPPELFLVVLLSGPPLNQIQLFNATVQVPFLRISVNDSSISQVTASVCPAVSLHNITSCFGPTVSSSLSLQSVILRVTVLLLTSSSAAVSVVMSEASGPRLPQFFSVAVTDVATNSLHTSFIGSADTTMTFFGLRLLSSYRCLVRSLDGRGLFLRSSYTTDIFTSLSPPTLFTVSPVNATSIRASWVHPATSSSASLYSVTAYINSSVVLSVNVSAPAISGSVTVTLSSLLSHHRYTLLLSGFNFKVSNFSSQFAIGTARPSLTAVCVASTNLQMTTPFTAPYFFRVSWTAPSFTSSDAVFIAGYTVLWLSPNGSQIILLRQSPASSAPLPLPLVPLTNVSVWISTTMSIDGVLSDGPYCAFNISVGAMPELILSDSSGRLINGTTRIVYPGQSVFVSFSTFHADSGEHLTLRSSGKYAMAVRNVVCNFILFLQVLTKLLHFSFRHRTLCHTDQSQVSFAQWFYHR